MKPLKLDFSDVLDWKRHQEAMTYKLEMLSSYKDSFSDIDGLDLECPSYEEYDPFKDCSLPE